jgi:hypothetical protein
MCTENVSKERAAFVAKKLTLAQSSEIVGVQPLGIQCFRAEAKRVAFSSLLQIQTVARFVEENSPAPAYRWTR